MGRASAHLMCNLLQGPCPQQGGPCKEVSQSAHTPCTSEGFWALCEFERVPPTDLLGGPFDGISPS